MANGCKWCHFTNIHHAEKMTPFANDPIVFFPFTMVSFCQYPFVILPIYTTASNLIHSENPWIIQGNRSSHARVFPGTTCYMLAMAWRRLLGVRTLTHGGFHSHGGYHNSWLIYQGKNHESTDDDWGLPPLMEPPTCLTCLLILESP